MNDKNVEMMRKLLEEKKQKSAVRGVGKGETDSASNTHLGKRKTKKGGLFDK
jgi:hypothetical protein